ncbi:AraC family transcriptional regulator N-terminal domain-containing protein [Cohnella sp. GCM10027633]|uniref:AraC family transcriptional regulator n=1 Tax=unclassified Cohnella TaxID=2636738 RepID=UPI00363EC44F
MIDQLIDGTQRITVTEGRTPTIAPFLSIVRRNGDTARNPGVLTPSFCLILQGDKRLYLGERIFQYGTGDYLASLLDIPASAQVVGASPDKPYIGLRVDFTTQEIASVVMEADIRKPSPASPTAAAFVGKADADLLDIFHRLLQRVVQGRDDAFRLELLKKEMLYNLLSGDYGHLFLQRGLFDQRADGVAKAIQWITRNYARSFTVEELAKSCNMSVSGLHHKFKAITTMGPLQYQKQLRLQEARRLLLSGPIGATSAAMAVGYDSPTQFNREYRRLFGQPPLQDAKAMRLASGVASFADS